MSPRCNSAREGSFSRLPVASESSTCTSSPRAISASATCEPMKPAPPVTIARKASYPRPRMFITFEGLDGSGKSTQAELLAKAIRETGRDVVTTREPGGTPLGERVRELLLTGNGISPWAEAALFAAARAELVEEVIGPALEREAIVICDRYLDSSLAYQGVERVLQLNLPAIGERLPDRTFLLEIDPDESARRVGQNGDRIEREDEQFRRQVADAYRLLAETFPQRIEAVDGRRPPADIAKEIFGRVRESL